jgi:hypothetical protein
MLWRFAVILLALVVAWMGVKEHTLSGVAKAEPKVVTCAQLEKEGPGDNAHLTLSDFLLTSSFVYEAKKGSTSGWKRVWVPAVPLDGPYAREAMAAYHANPDAEVPPPKDFRVVVAFDDVRDAKGLEAAGDRDTLTGVVVNVIEKIPSDTRRLLEQNYPGVPVDKCWILEVGRKPKRASTAYMMIAAGAAGALFGVWLVVRGFQRRRAPTPDADAQA